LVCLVLSHSGIYLNLNRHVAFGVPEDGRPNAFPKRKDGKILVDYDLTRDFVKTWQAMEALVDKGKVKVRPPTFILVVGIFCFDILIWHVHF